MEQGVLDTLYQVLASPSRGLRKVTQSQPLGWAIGVAVLVSLVIALSLLPNPPGLIEAIFHLEGGSFNFVLAVFSVIGSFLFGLLLAGGVFHGMAKLLRGQGSYWGVFCGLCFAFFPGVIFAPLMLLQALLGFPGQILFLVGALVLFPWILILQILAISQNYGFPTRRAIATFFIPAVILGVLPVLAAAISMAL